MIIDGIDVSGCGFIHEDTGTECHIALAFSEEYGECWHCEQIENCYYKQLKRAEENLEKLAQLHNDLINRVSLENIKRIEQENVTLERTCNELRKRHSEDTTRLSAEVMELKAENEKLKAEIKALINKPVFLPNIEEQATNKYKKALMDIREIAGSIIGDANATYTEFFEKLSNILDKINEVIGVEE